MGLKRREGALLDNDSRESQWEIVLLVGEIEKSKSGWGVARQLLVNGNGGEETFIRRSA